MKGCKECLLCTFVVTGLSSENPQRTLSNITDSESTIEEKELPLKCWVACHSTHTHLAFHFTSHYTFEYLIEGM